MVGAGTETTAPVLLLALLWLRLALGPLPGHDVRKREPLLNRLAVMREPLLDRVFLVGEPLPSTILGSSCLCMLESAQVTMLQAAHEGPSLSSCTASVMESGSMTATCGQRLLLVDDRRNVITPSKSMSRWRTVRFSQSTFG
jgi:hypothetical protein